MIQDWQSGKWDVGWNSGHAVPCFIVDLSGTKTLLLFSTLSYICIHEKGSDELKWLRLNWKDLQPRLPLNPRIFCWRNGDGAVCLSAWCSGIFHSCCTNNLIYTVCLYCWTVQEQQLALAPAPRALNVGCGTLEQWSRWRE